jgi:O-antigen ligase
MSFQLIQSMRIDAFELTQSRLNLLGYLIAFALSLILGYRLYRSRRMMLLSVLVVLLLIFYTTIIREVTAPSLPFVSFLFSRFGLVMWFVLGIGFAAVLDILQKLSFRRDRKQARKVIFLVIFCQCLFALFFAYEIILMPPVTISYQAVAYGLMIYLIILVGILQVVWGKSLSWMLIISLFFIITVLVFSVVLLKSTVIVAFWLGLISIFIVMKLRDSSIKMRLVVAFIFLMGLIAFARSDIFESIVKITRFSVLLSNDGEFTSVTSRLGIVDTFWKQFKVSPIFGHFEAEIISGVGRGDYMHSLPLSLLTHTGIIGTGIFTMILIILFGNRIKAKRKLDPSELFFMLLMLLVLGLGTISAFMTLPVLWFMFGCLCRRPRYSSERIRYARDH